MCCCHASDRLLHMFVQAEAPRFTYCLIHPTCFILYTLCSELRNLLMTDGVYFSPHLTCSCYYLTALSTLSSFNVRLLVSHCVLFISLNLIAVLCDLIVGMVPSIYSFKKKSPICHDSCQYTPILYNYGASVKPKIDLHCIWFKCEHLGFLSRDPFYHWYHFTISTK